MPMLPSPIPFPVPRAARRRLAAAWAAVLLALPACAGGPSTPATAVDRETFIATYVELRAAAIRMATAELSDEARSEILARNGVSEESLLAFVEAHGEDVEFMRALWDEVEARLEAVRVQGGPGDPS